MKVFNSKNLGQVGQFIQQGNLLAYPTEAVWGIGCDPFNEQAVKQILAIKNRPIEKGMIVIAPSVASIQPFFTILSHSQTQAILHSWNTQNELKQATTWLFPILPHFTIKIPDWLTGGHDSLAIRVIAHPTIAKICQNLISSNNPYGFLISTSCNPSGKTPAKKCYRGSRLFWRYDWLF